MSRPTRRAWRATTKQPVETLAIFVLQEAILAGRPLEWRDLVPGNQNRP